MFRIQRPDQSEIAHALAAARDLPDCAPQLLSLRGGPVRNVPESFAHDRSESMLGSGVKVFLGAKSAMRRWAEFDLGWVSVSNSTAPVAPGQLIAVLAHTIGLWSLNISRILETVDSSTQFGFLYSTTRNHVEFGQERFLVNFDERQGTVSYLIEAFSKPRHPLARIGYSFTRGMQHRFARDSHASMKSCVLQAEQDSGSSG